MPFESGSLTVTVFYLSEKLPENFLELFAANKAGMLDHVKDEPQIGWVSGRHLLETNIDQETAICGGHLYLHMRKAERKIPNALLKAICKREELVYMKANETTIVPSKVRRDIKNTATEQYLMKMPPGMNGVPMVVDLTSNVLYLGTASTKQIDEFVGLFYKTTNIEPLQMGVQEIMIRNQIGAENELPEVMFSDRSDSECIPARDFLTWLWYYSENESGRVSAGQFGEFEAMIEAPLTFAFAAEAKGAAETTLKKGGSPLRSAEAKAALIVGKKLKKAKLTLARGEDIWSCTFDADRFCFGGLSLPEGEEMEPHSRFAERILNMHIFQEVIQEYFKLFVELIKKPDWLETEKKLQQWAQERDSY